MSVTINGTNGLTFNDNTTQATSPFAGGLGFRNRIINGDMRIDQRNNGASVTNTGNLYTLDRWNSIGTVTSKFSVQRNAGSVTPPSGFTNYLGVTSLSAYSVGSTDIFQIEQHIEGFNTADLAWGTAGAQAVTLSFWVRSSLTGTFAGALRNAGYNRSYPFSYTVNSANTWEQKTVTIAGDQSGTWATDNTAGIRIDFSLGAGSTYSGTAGSWSGSNFVSATGATSVVGTNGATFYITGVQLEKGSTATSFDYRDYGREDSLCKRYWRKNPRAYGVWINASALRVLFTHSTEMRASPSLTVIDTGAYHEHWNIVGYNGITSLGFNQTYPSGTDVVVNSSSNRGRSYGDPAILEQGALALNSEL